MEGKVHTVSYMTEELANLKTSEGTQSDWSAAAAMTPAQIETNIAADPDEEGMVMDWDNASVKLPVL